MRNCIRFSLLAFVFALAAIGQTFSSGSTGADGALDLTAGDGQWCCPLPVSQLHHGQHPGWKDADLPKQPHERCGHHACARRGEYRRCDKHFGQRRHAGSRGLLWRRYRASWSWAGRWSSSRLARAAPTVKAVAGLAPYSTSFQTLEVPEAVASRVRLCWLSATHIPFRGGGGGAITIASSGSITVSGSIQRADRQTR